MTEKNKEVIITYGTKADASFLDSEVARWSALVYDSGTEYLSLKVLCNGERNSKVKIKFKKVG